MGEVRTALVVGGGPAGMTTAIALSRVGVECSIVELETDWRPAGIGIGLHSPPLRALKTLDLFDDVVAIGRPHPVIEMQTAGGDPIATMPQPNVNEPDDPPFVTMSRIALHSVLERAVRAHDVPVRLGMTVDALEEDGDGVRATLSDGSVETVDLVVGADGLHSHVRSLVLPDAPETGYSGQIIWRLGAKTPPGLERYTMMVGGPTRIGLVPLGGDDLYLWMLDVTIGPERPPREQMRELFLERLDAYGGFAPAVADQVTDGSALDFRALHWLLVPPPWHAGRVVLIGDAVHATTPHLAYGAGIAIEDAVVLGELAAEGVSADALGERLVARRFDRCRTIVENALQLSRWEQEPGPPGPEAGQLIGATFARMAEPI